jgi:hypothetical protein
MKFKINNMNWEITEVEENQHNEVGLLGRCDSQQNRITVLADMPPCKKKEVLIHELTHAFLSVYHLDLYFENTFSQEELCDFVAKFSPEINKIANDYFKQKPTLEGVGVGTPQPRTPTAPCPKPKSVNVGDGSLKEFYDNPNINY